MAGPPGAAPPPDELSCPRCGATVGAGQEYCVECGLRLDATRTVGTRLGRAWQRRLPYYPGDWIWPALAGLVVASLATAVVVAFAEESRPAETIVATQPTSPPLTQTTTPVPTTTTAPEQTTTARPSTRRPPPQPPQTLKPWPRGTNGYTVVLESIPTTAGRPLATEKGREALSAGLRDVGVLVSSEHASLHPGYYVVFSGVYESSADAERAVGAARDAGYPAAYARPITS